MNVYFVYKVLTNRIRALIIAAGYIASIHTHVCNEVTLVWGSLRLTPIILADILACLYLII